MLILKALVTVLIQAIVLLSALVDDACEQK